MYFNVHKTAAVHVFAVAIISTSTHNYILFIIKFTSLGTGGHTQEAESV